MIIRICSYNCTNTCYHRTDTHTSISTLCWKCFISIDINYNIRTGREKFQCNIDYKHRQILNLKRNIQWMMFVFKECFQYLDYLWVKTFELVQLVMWRMRERWQINSRAIYDPIDREQVEQQNRQRIQPKHWYRMKCMDSSTMYLWNSLKSILWWHIHRWCTCVLWDSIENKILYKPETKEISTRRQMLVCLTIDMT